MVGTLQPLDNQSICSCIHFRSRELTLEHNSVVAHLCLEVVTFRAYTELCLKALKTISVEDSKCNEAY